MPSRTDLIEIISGKRRGFIAGSVRLVLGLLTPAYRLVIWVRNRRFDNAIARQNRPAVKRAGVPVISIGNLTTGGTGKTPLVVWIAEHLKKRKLRVGLVSRGYGSHPTESGYAKNDEAKELAQRLPDVPHLQNPDRHRMSQEAIAKFDSQIIVLDDGFQHRQIHRDLDIVLIDATAPFGYDRLLPRGLLREPASSLRRADLVILTRADLVTDNQRESTISRVRNQIGDRPIAETRTNATGLLQFEGQHAQLDTINGQPVFFFCGIGNPANFQILLNRLGMDVQGSTVFADHHDYTLSDLQRIGESAAACRAAVIICTHKDLVKVGTNELEGLPVYALVTDVEFIAGQHTIEENLDRLIDGISGDANQRNI